VLSGGVVVLAGGLVAPERLARGALAAHAGCVLAMPVSVLICALSWPWSVAMLADAAITVPVTLLAWRLLSLPGSRARCRARQGVPSV
jgi:membrane protein implicated in regulation of membrane protease activity